MERLTFDIISALTLAVTALLGAYLPVLLHARDRLRGGTGRSRAYVLGNLFSAGVMVSAGFCHLLGEALKQMPAMQFPLAPFLCGLGFLMTLGADQIASRVSGGGGGCSHDALVSPAPLPPPLVLADSSMELGDSARAEAGAGSARSKREERLPVGEKTALLGGGPSGLDPGLDGPEAAPNGRLALDLEDPRAAGPEGGKANSARGALSLSSGARTPLRRQQGRDGGSGGASSSRIAFVTAMLMGVALCFHSVLEGAAMGAQVTISASIHIFIAIVSHKGLAAYALGSSLVDSGAGEQRFWSVILPFAAASPFGIVLGFIISDVARGIGAASISALASGTFLYVAFMEVIPKELRDRGFPGAKLACLFGGFAIMSILAVWA